MISSFVLILEKGGVVGLEKFRDAGEKEKYQNEYVNVDVVVSGIRKGMRRFDSNDIKNPRLAQRCFPRKISKAK